MNCTKVKYQESGQTIRSDCNVETVPVSSQNQKVRKTLKRQIKKSQNTCNDSPATVSNKRKPKHNKIEPQPKKKLKRNKENNNPKKVDVGKQTANITSTALNSNKSFEKFVSSFVEMMNEKEQLQNKTLPDTVLRKVQNYSDDISSDIEIKLPKERLSTDSSITSDLYVETVQKPTNISLHLSDSDSTIIITPIVDTVTCEIPSNNSDTPNIENGSFFTINKIEVNTDFKNDIYNWIVSEPPQLSESCKTKIKKGLETCIQFVNMSLDSLKGPIHPSNRNLYYTLTNLENVLSKYLKKY